MSNDSTQPFDINENTGEPSHRPEHDRARRDADEQLDDQNAADITPEDITPEHTAED